MTVKQVDSASRTSFSIQMHVSYSISKVESSVRNCAVTSAELKIAVSSHIFVYVLVGNSTTVIQIVTSINRHAFSKLTSSP
jgi:hypothetical protein